jgi:hypothetical protein
MGKKHPASASPNLEDGGEHGGEPSPSHLGTVLPPKGRRRMRTSVKKNSKIFLKKPRGFEENMICSMQGVHALSFNPCLPSAFVLRKRKSTASLVRILASESFRHFLPLLVSLVGLYPASFGINDGGSAPGKALRYGRKKKVSLR